MQTSQNGGKTWPLVRELSGGRIQVDLGYRLGKRIRKRFPDRILAEDWIENKRRELENLGTEAAAILTDEAKRDAVEALRLLRGAGSLRQAAEFYRRHAPIAARSISFSDLQEEFLDSKVHANRRFETVRNYRQRLNRFGARFGDRRVHEISTREIERWVSEGEYSAISRRNDLNALTVVFNFAVRRGYLVVNPASAIDKPSTDERVPEILSIDEVTALLKAAAGNVAWQPMVPYLSISLFAGLRPTELKLLQRKNINVNERFIRVTPPTAKRRRQRLVDVSENLAEWLQAYPVAGDEIFFSRKYFTRIRGKAAVAWSKQILRHTFVSFHLAQHEDAAKTALQVGHLRVDVMFNHYRNLVTKSDASCFWSLSPSSIL